MTERVRRLFVHLLYIVVDIVCMGVCIWAVCQVRQETLSFSPTFYNIFLSNQHPYRFVFIFWILVTVLVNKSHGLYQTKREIFESFEVWDVVRSAAFASFLTIVAIYVVRAENFPRSIIFAGTALIAAVFSVWRFFKRMMVGYFVSRGYNNVNVLIIGAGRIGKALANEIYKRPELGFNVVGYLDDFVHDYEDRFHNKIVGKISDFKRIVLQEFISRIFITTHTDSAAFLKLLKEARDLGVGIRVVPHGFELMSGEGLKYNIGLIPVLEYCDAVPSRRQFGKRIFDFIIAGAGLLCLLPFFVIIAVAIKLDSRGPVFYASKRYGRSGRIFNMYKFRSMCIEADEMLDSLKRKNEVDGPIFKIRNDPRVTRIGKFLRKYSLDELPQIFNVLKGDMSLVGPRPLPINQVRKEDLRQVRRLEVKPGITGLWQIKGRSDISFERLVKLDTWYINNWSFWLDLNILLRTIPVVIKARGAY